MVVDNFTYPGSCISINLSLDSELNVRIGEAAKTMARLVKRVWDNPLLTINTKMKMYQAFKLNTFSVVVRPGHLYSRQERKLNAFHVPQTTPWHHLAKQHHKYREPVKGRHNQHVLHTDSQATTLARPCVQMDE